MLGDFLNFLVKRRRRLDVRVLTWDYPVIFAKGRELSPIYGFGWRPHRRVRLRYDDHYPVGASQHQKIVVIDGALAFCGGLDLTRSRWDTPAHGRGDERRINEGETTPTRRFTTPMMAVDGDAARVLDEVVRERWVRATGSDPLKNVTRASMARDPWPDDRCRVALDGHRCRRRAHRRADRRRAAHPRSAGSCYLDMIAAAQRSIYIENQYFTSNTLGEALAARLARTGRPGSHRGAAPVDARLARSADDGHAAHGAAEEAARRRPARPLPRVLPAHSRACRTASAATCIRSSMIVDDECCASARPTSRNRSMGLDTECDVAIEARGDERVAEAIRDFRNPLLAEHLGVPPRDGGGRASQAGGSVSAAIDSADERRPHAQTLRASR